ncbi:MAG: ABC transporter permease [Cytophagales bacterium]|nr:ABC transporter permease [Cytophaga sp.]
MAENYTKKRKKILGSYPYATVIFSITLSLTVIGLFGLILINAQAVKSIINNQIGEVQIYVHNHISDSLSNAFKSELYSKPYLLKSSDGKPLIDFKTKEEAKKEYISQTGQDFTKIIDENPLRDAYIIHISEDHTDSASMHFIVEELNAYPAVYEVIYEEALLKKVTRNIQNVGLILAGFALLLTIATIFLINNTLKLALYSQRFLIRSMQLVGARPFFIQKPFIYRAILHGAIGGILASLLLHGLQQYAFATIEDLVKLYIPEQTFMLYGALVATGATIGFISSFRSVKKYMYMSLDDLY